MIVSKVNFYSKHHEKYKFILVYSSSISFKLISITSSSIMPTLPILFKTGKLVMILILDRSNEH